MAPTSPLVPDWMRPTRADALAAFFSQLARLVDSLGTVSGALRLLGEPGGRGSMAAAAEDLHRMVSSGMPLAAAMSLRGEPFRPTWIRLVEAAERSGRLPEALERIASRIHRRASLGRSIRTSLPYPLFLVHAALLLWPVTSLVRDGGGAYLARVAVSLALLWGTVAAVGFFAARSLRKAVEPAIPQGLPIVGTIVRDLRAAEMCWSLGALYESGASLRSAVESVIPRPSHGDTPLGRAIDRFRAGSEFAELVRDSGLFPEDTVQVLRIGEASGNLGESLLSEGERVETRAAERLERAVAWAGRCIYGIAVAAAAWVVLSFWLDYLAGIAAVASITTPHGVDACVPWPASESPTRCRRTPGR